MGSCIKCAGSGKMGNGEICDCGAQLQKEVYLPKCLNIPIQYQSVKYSKRFLRESQQNTLGVFMEALLTEITNNLHTFNKNYIICAPPNSGKTVWAYNIYSTLFSKGINVPEIMDLMQVREIMLNYYSEYADKQQLINESKIMIVKLPMDLPNKFPETISTIIDRRVRNSCSTIFLFNGSKNDLLNQDRFNKLEYMLGDGAFNSICIESFD